MTRVTSNTAALHEAAHAGALLAAGWAPLSTRLDYPFAKANGGTTPDWDARDINDAGAMKDLLVAVLAGPALEGTLVDDWPIIADVWPQGSERDGEMSRFICEFLSFDQVDWLRYVYAAQELARTPVFRRLVVEIANALDEAELLLQPELTAIYERSDYARRP